MAVNEIPQAWSTAEQLEGVDLINKGELEDKPLRVAQVYFETNKRGVEFAYVTVEKTSGEYVMFNDSSTGVRQQLKDYVTAKGQGDAIDSGAKVQLSLVLPRGLRKSEFDTLDDHGRPTKGKTYYMTASGTAPVPAAPAPAKAAASRPIAGGRARKS